MDERRVHGKVWNVIFVGYLGICGIVYLFGFAIAPWIPMARHPYLFPIAFSLSGHLLGAWSGILNVRTMQPSPKEKLLDPAGGWARFSHLLLSLVLICGDIVMSRDALSLAAHPPVHVWNDAQVIKSTFGVGFYGFIASHYAATLLTVLWRMRQGREG